MDQSGSYIHWCFHNKKGHSERPTVSEETERYREENDGGKEQSDVSISHGTPRIAVSHQKLGGGKKGFYLESQKDHSPSDTLALDSRTMRE